MDGIQLHTVCALPCPVPCWHGPLTFLLGPWGRSQLSADVGKQRGGWMGRLSGPALCPENLLCHCSSARQAQPTGHFPCPWQDRAVGPSSPASCSADHGGYLLPMGPRNRSLQYKCKCAAVPSLRLAAPACAAGWGHELTLAQRDKAFLGRPHPWPCPLRLSAPQRPQGVQPFLSAAHKAWDEPVKVPLLQLWRAASIAASSVAILTLLPSYPPGLAGQSQEAGLERAGGLGANLYHILHQAPGCH